MNNVSLKQEEASAPLVSVCVVTYNHASYIEACLESLAKQLTEYTYEVIVGVDPCTDGTEQIIDAVAQRYSGLFRIIHHPERLGAVGNFRRTHRAARGDLVAHMDGDDLAYPNKIQSQVKALHRYPDAALCGHTVDLINTDGAKLGPRFPEQNIAVKTYILEDALTKGSLFAHSSFMYRRRFADHLFGTAKEIIDYSNLIGFLNRGPAISLNQPLGAYRITSGGATQQLTNKIRLLLFLDVYEYLLGQSYDKPGMVLAAAVADSGKLLLRDREVRDRIMKIILKAKRLPDPFVVAKIRRERRNYGKTLHDAFTI